MIPDGHWRQHLPTSSSSHPHQTDFIQWVAAPWRTTGYLPSVLCEYYSPFTTSCVTLYLSAFLSRPSLIVRLISINVSCWLWGFISFQSHDWDVCGQRGLLFSRNISRFDKGLLFSLTPLRQFDTEATVCFFFFCFLFFCVIFFCVNQFSLTKWAVFKQGRVYFDIARSDDGYLFSRYFELADFFYAS